MDHCQTVVTITSHVAVGLARVSESTMKITSRSLSSVLLSTMSSCSSIAIAVSDGDGDAEDKNYQHAT